MIPPGEPCCSMSSVMTAVTMLARSLLSKLTPTLKGRCRAEIRKHQEINAQLDCQLCSQVSIKFDLNASKKLY